MVTEFNVVNYIGFVCPSLMYFIIIVAGSDLKSKKNYLITRSDIQIPQPAPELKFFNPIQLFPQHPNHKKHPKSNRPYAQPQTTFYHSNLPVLISATNPNPIPSPLPLPQLHLPPPTTPPIPPSHLPDLQIPPIPTQKPPSQQHHLPR
jgi:hypothetical protein